MFKAYFFSVCSFFAVLFSLLPSNLFGQTATENYIKSISYSIETQNGIVPEEEKLESIVYYDGLNRPKQGISERTGGNGEDLITPFFYDQYGRKTIEYLPLPVLDNDGSFYNGINGNITGEIKSYYKQKFPNDFYSPPGLHPDWDNPYFQNDLENSSLGRVIEKGAPGYDWRIGNGGEHSQQYDYKANFENEVKKYNVQYDVNGLASLGLSGFYNANELFKTISKNENWANGLLNTEETFTDKNGRIILKNEYVRINNQVTKLETYFVYDALGRLIFKIPPKATDEIFGSSTISYQEFQTNVSLENFIESPSSTDGDGTAYFDLTEQTDINGNISYLLSWDINFSDIEDWSYPDYGAYLKVGDLYNFPNNGNFLPDQHLFNIPHPVYPNSIWYEFNLISNKLNVTLKNINGPDNDPNFMFLITEILNDSQLSIAGITKIYDDAQYSWSIKDFISPSNSSLDGNIYLEIEDDILTLGGAFGLDPYQVYATLNSQTIKILNTSPTLPDMFLGQLVGHDGPTNDNFIVGDIKIENSNLVITRLSSDSFLALTINPIEKDLSTSLLDKFAFQYTYDDYNRKVAQKTPGKGWEETIYDGLDRPVLTRDAKLKIQNKWLFTKYDIFGRVAYTGIYTSTVPKNTLETEFTDQPLVYEERLANPEIVGDTSLYYSNNAFPKQNIEILTINYYDVYIDHVGVSLPTSVFGNSTQNSVQGLPTVNRVRVLGTDDWVVSILGYDKKSNLIYSSTKNNYLQSLDTKKSKIDFIGKVIEDEITHLKTGNSQIKTRNFYSYDHTGRLVTHQQRLDNEPIQLIAHNTYDELGRLVNKKVGGELFKNGYTDLVKVTVNSAGVIYKTDASDTWNAGLATIGKLEANGGISFMVPNEQRYMRIGLSDVNTNPGTGDLDFYFYFYKNSNNESVFTTYARNLQTGGIVSLSTHQYVTNDTFAIEWVGNEIKYLQNGSVVNTYVLISELAFLIGDLSFRSPNSLIRDLNFYAAGAINKYLQDIDYKFNVRGWLTDINNIDASSIDVRANDLFNFRINYNEALIGSAGDSGNAIPLFNGNISQTTWSTKNTDSQKHSYGYKYDDLNRILTAYSRKGNDLNTLDDHTLSGITYDKNGNILTLKRSGLGTTKNWDDLTYEYDANRLMGVRDLSTCSCKSKGFNDSNNSHQDYTYDINGNLTSDENKYIESIEYNILDLPSSILVNNNGSGGVINYVYDALGNKLEKTFVEFGPNGQSITTQYAGNYVYEKDHNYSVLQFIGQPEGYIVPTAILPSGGVTGWDEGTGQTTYSTYSYVFQYKDHLGNVRLSYSDINKNGNIEFGNEIIEESNFYPFGIKHWGYNDYYTGLGNAVAQQYKFAGKQLQEELGLNYYDFGARNYDPTLGRWFNTDPLNQFSSPYVSFNNNPIIYVDPDGQWVHIVVGAVIGGVVNTAANWKNIDGWGDGLSYFGVGVVGGAVMATGNVAAGGAIFGGGNAIINEVKSPGQFDVGNVIKGAVFGGISAYAGGVLSSYISPVVSGMFANAPPIFSQYMSGAIVSVSSGLVLETAAGVVQGQNFKDSFNAATDNVYMNAGIGLVSVYGSRASAKYSNKVQQEKAAMQKLEESRVRELSKNQSVTIPLGDENLSSFDNQYSVAFETTLDASLYPGKGYYSHFKAANISLSNAMSDPVFSSSMSELGISIPRSSTGSILGKSPANWVWHHDINAGTMQLVPKVQHTIGSPFWNTMHPGGFGGMSIWGR